MAFGVKRTHLLTVIAVILRVPSIFIIHAWCLLDPHETAKEFTENNLSTQLVTTVYYVVVIFALYIALLPLRKLVDLYMCLINGLLLYIAYYVSSMYVAGLKIKLKDPTDHNCEQWVFKHFTFRTLVLVQFGVATLITYLTEVRNWKKYGLFLYTLPLIGHAFGIPIDLVENLHNVAASFIFSILALLAFSNFSTVVNKLKDLGLVDLFIGVNGVSHGLKVLLQQVYTRPWGLMYSLLLIITNLILRILHLPKQLLVFWLCLFSVQFYIFNSSDMVSEHPWEWFFYVLGKSCETTVSLIALCVTISYVSCCIIMLAKLFVQGVRDFQPDIDDTNGLIEGLIMILLAFHTGLLNETDVHRGVIIIGCLTHVVSSIFKSMHEVYDPILLSLGAQYNRNIGKHVRAILLSLFLIVCPLYMTYSICKYFDYDYFILFGMSGCLLTPVQVVGSFIIYTLFMYEARLAEPLDALDDVIYKVKSSVQLMEYFVVFLCISCILKDVFVWKWTWTSLLLLLMYCFCLTEELQNQWRNFILRRETIQRLESLPLATDEQLKDYNDVCAICYQSMTAARITHCKHFFHATCLKKWLYVKDSCPMCHKRIDQPEEGEATHDKAEST